jgi:hypothetical protein
LEEIKKQRGFSLDAAVVDACLKLFEEKDFNFKLDEPGAVMDAHWV